MSVTRLVWLACLVLAVPTALAQGVYDDGLLAVKRMFADHEIAAINEPYVGIGTSNGIASGLFPIESTGVTTEPIRQRQRLLRYKLLSGNLLCFSIHTAEILHQYQ